MPVAVEQGGATVPVNVVVNREVGLRKLKPEPNPRFTDPGLSSRRKVRIWRDSIFNVADSVRCGDFDGPWANRSALIQVAPTCPSTGRTPCAAAFKKPQLTSVPWMTWRAASDEIGGASIRR